MLQIGWVMTREELKHEQTRINAVSLYKRTDTLEGLPRCEGAMKKDGYFWLEGMIRRRQSVSDN
jgi:hypothetical protein